jgi:hypothetical protein
MVDAATAVQDQVLDTITTAQDATLKVLKGWTDTLSSKMDTFYGFAEKLWATEKDFFVKLLEVATEAGKKVPDAAKKTAAAAAK